MCFIWASFSFNFYLIGIDLKYLPGDLYRNSLASGIADIIGMIISGVLIQKISAKETLKLFFLIAGFSGLVLMFSTNFSFLFLFLSRGCICATGNIMFYLTVSMFRPSVAATAMGLCNVVSRLLTMAAPVVVEFEEPTPLTIYTFMCFAAVICVIALNEIDEDEKPVKSTGNFLKYN